MSDTAFVWAVGFLAQGFFSTRILVQWVRSECARRVLSPSLFWALSLVGAWLFLFYGWLRHDFAIVFGQLISYYIYIWNLRAKGEWQRLPGVWRWVLQLSPVVAMGYVAADAPRVVARFLGNADVPLWLLLFGLAGQLLFTLRFVYQWVCSSRIHTSVLPPGFWLFSLAGATAIVCYGLIRHDIVLIVGQTFGIVAYSRNLYIGYKQSTQKLTTT